MVEHGFGKGRAFADFHRDRASGVAGFAAAVCIAAGIALAGCATTGGISKDAALEVKRAAVTERVNAYWAVMIKGDREAAYAFLSPASKELVSLASFKSGVRQGFTEAKVESVTCDGELCQVRLMLKYQPRQMSGPLITPVDESWVLENGQFWHIWRQ